MIEAFISVRVLDIIDILLVAFIFYQIYMLIKGTVAINIFVGIFSVYLLWLFVKALNMQLLGTILGQVIGVGVIAIIIVFQQEIRNALLIIGSKQITNRRLVFFRLFFGTETPESVNVDAIVKSAKSMSLSNTGALIVIQKRINLQSFIKVKDVLDAETSNRLLTNIFFKNSPLHDGAVIITGSKIYAARCVLPVSEKELPANFGMRHRAAVGITENTDAVAVVVSEETGTISCAKNGNVDYNINHQKLRNILETEFQTSNN